LIWTTVTSLNTMGRLRDGFGGPAESVFGRCWWMLRVVP
jgi:hypothetical protein